MWHAHPLPSEPGAGAVRRRARTAAAAMAVVTALPLALGALSEGSILATAPALVAGLTALVFLPDLCQERPPARHSRTRSTAHTLTGRRSVDLTRVTSVPQEDVPCGQRSRGSGAGEPV
jgi:hypothetical protein